MSILRHDDRWVNDNAQRSIIYNGIKVGAALVLHAPTCEDAISGRPDSMCWFALIVNLVT